LRRATFPAGEGFYAPPSGKKKRFVAGEHTATKGQLLKNIPIYQTFFAEMQNTINLFWKTLAILLFS
jgi:hypothetical protein